ncbi:MAG TPA: tryptophan synthase subunit beta, partial [Deinococcales bacterium]|nr:tryptophan synthase subunit beta [Deinococcales bacterium]
GVGPEHSHYAQAGVAEYVAVTDREALAAFQKLSRLEGIIPALESSHAIAYLPRLAERLPSGSVVVANLSGRGDKDVDETMRLLALEEQA